MICGNCNKTIKTKYVTCEHFVNPTPESLSVSCAYAPISSSNHLYLIHEKLTKLESLNTSLNKRFTEMQASIDTLLQEVSTRMTNFKERLSSPLADFSLLLSRLLAAEEVISQV